MSRGRCAGRRSCEPGSGEHNFRDQMESGSDIAQVAASGLLMGLAYALVAVGFTIVFGVMNVVNFAHGHIAMAAMFASYALNRYLGLDPYLAALCLFPVFLVVGALLYRVAIAP